MYYIIIYQVHNKWGFSWKGFKDWPHIHGKTLCLCLLSWEGDCVCFIFLVFKDDGWDDEVSHHSSKPLKKCQISLKILEDQK